MIRKGHTAFDQAGAFGLQQLPLKAGKWFADGDSSAGGDNPVPGNGLTTWASSHGSSGGTSAAGEPNGAGQLAVSGDAAFGNPFNQSVEAFPAGVHVRKDTYDGLELPEARALDTLGDVRMISRQWNASYQFGDFKKHNRQKNSQ
jgi:hypothetical protein